jgi:hypothetical protein
VIKRICNSGVTIICTIHQPSIDLYALFDRYEAPPAAACCHWAVGLMGQPGHGGEEGDWPVSIHSLLWSSYPPRKRMGAAACRLMDRGACRLLLLVSGEIVYLGDAQKAVPYFESLGFRSAPHENPADFLGRCGRRAVCAHLARETSPSPG